MKTFLAGCFALSIFFISCKKNAAGNIDSNVKIELVEGNNQSDTIGRVLKDSLQFRVTRNGIPLPYPFFEISVQSCPKSESALLRGDINGVLYLPWTLNSTVGSQIMEASVTDSLGKKLDSISAIATGQSFDHGWMPGDCLSFVMPFNFYKLSTGRILATDGAQFHYSDNNGISWSDLSSFPDKSGQGYQLSIYKQNIFALNDFNLWYSADNGITWKSLHNVIDSMGGSISSLGITSDGIVLLGTPTVIGVSTDFLQTWVKNVTPPTLENIHFFLFNSNLAETPQGTLFTVSDDGRLFQSVDTGANWIEINLQAHINSVFADDNGDVYVSASGGENSLYRLPNLSSGGFNLIVSFPPITSTTSTITNISKVNNNYYFLVGGYGLMKTSDFKSFQNLKSGFVPSYCITNSNTAIVCDFPDNLFYNSNFYSYHYQSEYNVNP